MTMGTSGPFTFKVGVRRHGALLRAAPASVNACLEDTTWQGVLAGELPNGELPPMTIEPLWIAGAAPRVAGVRVVLPGGAAREYGLQVFEDRAQGLIRDLVRDRALRADDVVEWVVEAATEPERPAPRFRARTRRAPYPLRPGRLDDVPPGTLAVAIERDVLAAVRDRVLDAAAVECAGVLAGTLTHDRERGAARLEITDQVAVESGEGGASMTHFAFGANSFAAARRTIAGMAEGTAVVGWWHSHPPCADCPRNPSCRAETIFFSADDAQVHAAAFPAAYTVALVAGKLRNRPATDPGIALYAWRGATVEEIPLRRPAADTHGCALAGEVERPAPAAPAGADRDLGVVRTTVRVVRVEGQTPEEAQVDGGREERGTVREEEREEERKNDRREARRSAQDETTGG